MIVSHNDPNRVVIVLISADNPSVWNASGLICLLSLNRGEFISLFDIAI